MTPTPLSSLITDAAPALANHLWQSTAFAAAIWLLTLLLRNNHARIRYTLWLAASIKFLLPFSLLITLGTLLPRPQQIAPPSTIYSAIDTASQPFTQLDTPIAPTTPTPTLQARLTAQLPAALATLWLCGALTVLLIWITRWRHVHATLKKSTPITAGREHEILRRLQTQSTKQITQITLVRSPELMEPGIFGILRPTLLWPHRLSDHLEDHHIEAILAHETIHVRRRDNLTAALQMLVEAIFWFHPIVWWMERHMIEERERACDEAVIQQGGNPETYAESLLKACRFCLESPLPCIAGITGADLTRRVRSIMTQQLQQLGLARKLLLSASALAALAGPIILGALHTPPLLAQLLHANPESRPSFEVASVRLSNPDPTNKVSMDTGIRISANRFVAVNLTAKQLLMLAYDIQPGAENRIIADQNWINTNHYNIEAKLEDSLAAKSDREKMNQIPLMVQSLLADRFKLKISPSTRQQSVYALVQTKSGAKLTESTQTLPSSDPPHPGSGGIKNGSGIFVGVGATARQLAADLTTQPEVGGRVVLDQTGLKGNYDFTLRWSPDQNIDTASARSNDPNLPSGPSLFTALQEQLGLKLQPTKGPVEVLVIDHIEQPTGDPGGEAPPTPTQPEASTLKAPAFDVVSIKPHNPDAPKMFDGVMSAPDGVHASGTLQILIRSAYGFMKFPTDNQLSGVPNWGKTERFDIQAKMDDTDIAAMQKLSKEQQYERQQLMLQSMLADRFKLKVHHDTRQVPIYELVIAKNGSKLKEAKADELNPDGMKDKDGKLVDGHYLRYLGSGKVLGQLLPMANLANFLTQPDTGLGRPVVDKTGLAGMYNFHLSWQPNEDTSTDDSRPSIFTALQEQLGLRLQPATGKVEVLVIDSVDHPSEN